MRARHSLECPPNVLHGAAAPLRQEWLGVKKKILEKPGVRSPPLDRKVGLLYINEHLATAPNVFSARIIGCTEDELRKFKPPEVESRKEQPTRARANSQESEGPVPGAKSWIGAITGRKEPNADALKLLLSTDVVDLTEKEVKAHDLREHLEQQRLAMIKKEVDRTPDEKVLCQLFEQFLRGKKVNPEKARMRLVVEDLAESVPACRDQRWKCGPGYRYKRIALDYNRLCKPPSAEWQEKLAAQEQSPDVQKQKQEDDSAKATRNLLAAVRARLRTQKKLEAKEAEEAARKEKEEAERVLDSAEKAREEEIAVKAHLELVTRNQRLVDFCGDRLKAFS